MTIDNYYIIILYKRVLSVGENRFKGPKPLPETDQLYIANALPPQCPQTCFQAKCDVIESEDCLYLNVFVPTGQTKKLPVAVWLHGGGFGHGASNSFLYDARHVVTGKGVLLNLSNSFDGVSESSY